MTSGSLPNILDLDAYRSRREKVGTWPLTGAELKIYWINYLEKKAREKK